ncbi:arginase family protein [Modestobacter sp. VKM Ac-2977]|uniref:arginase family protein n=1 Tax=Modestobacter sp. VKM Ac-2977 TaxID=3004131 RepID=UPI0022AAD875|nr:arginase family protein [Modestobacter sp. VKM Ac-2977]MCZ2820746.1 arginase family protein [Modestobacter sp. VKM Ac-2977]
MPDRLALTLFNGRAGDHNDRAMTGGPLLAAELAARLHLAPATVGSPEPALDTDWQTELDAAMPVLRQMAARYEDIFAAGQVPVTALSRCTVALCTVPVVVRHHPGARVVWFDAHADLNTPATSGTGYLGGLALSGPAGLWDSGLGAGLSPADIVLVGARDIDPPEQLLLQGTPITHIAPGPDLATRLQEAIADRPVYVHLDCDVLEPGIVPTDYQVPGGLSLADLHAAAEVLATRPVLGVEIGELEAAPGDTPTGLAALVDALDPLLRAAAGR